MSLVGTYVNIAQNFKLIITEANDANGSGKGTMEWGPYSIPVTLHYHFKNSTGPETNLWVAGNQDDPNQYFAGAGYTLAPNYSAIQIGLSLSTENRVDSFVTRLDRQ